MILCYKNEGSDMAKEKYSEVLFHELPTDFDVFLNIAESTLNLPEKVAALFVIALRIYAVDRNLGLKMISFLRNEEKLDEKEVKNLLSEPLNKYSYLPLAFFKGASIDNAYTPELPYIVTIKDDGKKSLRRKFKTLYIGCPGVGMYRPITLEKKKRRKINKNLLGDPWFVTEYGSLTLPVPAPVQKKLDEKA